jgi:hypothetical protein
MKQPALYKRLADILRTSLVISDLGASDVELSVQPDRIVVQLWLSSLPRPFTEQQVLSIVARLQTQLLAQISSTPEFSKLTYSISDRDRLWAFFLEDTGKASMPLCNSHNGEIEWTVPSQYFIG